MLEAFDRHDDTAIAKALARGEILLNSEWGAVEIVGCDGKSLVAVRFPEEDEFAVLLQMDRAVHATRSLGAED